MKKITNLILLITLFTYSNSIISQISFTVSGDVVPLFYKGYAFEGGVNYKNNRFAFSINELELPNFANPNYDSVTKFRKSLNITASRFLNAEQTGLHYGLSFGVVNKESLTLLDSTGKPKLSVPTFNDSYIKVGINIGYFLFPFKKKENALKGIYIEPRVGLTYAINKKDILLGPSSIITKKPLAIEVPSINIGYKFSF